MSNRTDTRLCTLTEIQAVEQGLDPKFGRGWHVQSILHSSISGDDVEYLVVFEDTPETIPSDPSLPAISSSVYSVNSTLGSISSSLISLNDKVYSIGVTLHDIALLLTPDKEPV